MLTYTLLVSLPCHALPCTAQPPPLLRYLLLFRKSYIPSSHWPRLVMVERTTPFYASSRRGVVHVFPQENSCRLHPPFHRSPNTQVRWICVAAAPPCVNIWTLIYSRETKAKLAAALPEPPAPPPRPPALLTRPRSICESAPRQPWLAAGVCGVPPTPSPPLPSP